MRRALVLGGLGAILLPRVALAATLQMPNVTVGFGSGNPPGQMATSLEILIFLTLISLAPAFLILMTSFTRIVIVLSLLRSAIGVPTVPPNQVLVGLALFLTFFIMSPVFGRINDQALQPYLQGKLSYQVALDRGEQPLRSFMLRQTREQDLALFANATGQHSFRSPEQVPFTTLVPAFTLSEIETAFTMGFVLYLPFLIIDLVVASTLMSMGMMMLPPVMISMPFKLLLFVLVDGWGLVVHSLLISFH